MSKKKKAEADIFDEMDLANTPHYKAGCAFVVIFFLLLYIMGVMIFWMLGSNTMRASRRTTELHQARTPEEIRDEMRKLFGDFIINTDSAQEKIDQKIEEVKEEATNQAEEAIQEKINQAVEETTDSVSNGLEQQVNEELSSDQAEDN